MSTVEVTISGFAVTLLNVALSVGAKLAVTLRVALMVTGQVFVVPLALQSPPQPVNFAPFVGVAVNVTCVFAG
jgi:hypothetical protein